MPESGVAACLVPPSTGAIDRGEGLLGVWWLLRPVGVFEALRPRLLVTSISRGGLMFARGATEDVKAGVGGVPCREMISEAWPWVESEFARAGLCGSCAVTTKAFVSYHYPHTQYCRRL